MESKSRQQGRTALWEYVEHARVLPVPAVLDSSAAVLLHLLITELREPLVLDASTVREVLPVGALLLHSSIRARGDARPGVRIVNLAYRLRWQLHRHPLSAFLEAEPGSADASAVPQSPSRDAWQPALR